MMVGSLPTMRNNFRFLSVAIALVSGLHAQDPAALRAHTEFLSSDLLEGRSVPSRGLDIAAEYIAAQMRSIGLKPYGGSYYQDFSTKLVEAEWQGFRLVVSGLEIPSDQVSLVPGNAVRFKDATLIRPAPGQLAQLKAADVEGKVVMLESDFDPFAPRIAFARRLAELKPAAIIYLDPTGRRYQRYADPPAEGPAILRVRDPRLKAVREGRVSLDIPAGRRSTAVIRNVVGVLEGTDPTLRGEAVVLSGHFDHLGISNHTSGDKVFNGASDDISAIAVMLALAEAWKAKPGKRSLILAAFTGEEVGFLGARYFKDHPPVPLDKIRANVNLEMLGRPDCLEGTARGSVGLIGFEKSPLTAAFQAAATEFGAKLFLSERYSEAFRNRVDASVFRDTPVPAVTAIGCMTYADYHHVTDEVSRMDFADLTAQAKLIGVAVRRLLDDPRP
jgi:hypothetical protein